MSGAALLVIALNSAVIMSDRNESIVIMSDRFEKNDYLKRQRERFDNSEDIKQTERPSYMPALPPHFQWLYCTAEAIACSITRTKVSTPKCGNINSHTTFRSCRLSLPE